MGLKTKIALAVATCLGVGYFPGAPGTAGSALALPAAWGLYRQWGVVGVAAGALVAAALGLWAACVAETHYESHDSSHIVVDELAGQLVAVLAVPCTWPNLVVAFGWFRLFDSFKPWPASWADRELQSGLGVMLDDLLSGVYAAVATAALVYGGAVPWATTTIGGWLGSS